MPSDFNWFPSEDRIARSNLKRFMDRQGIKSFPEVLKRSSEDIEWFWDAVNKDLGIEWYREYEKVLDASNGIQRPKWFVGGKINIAHNCLDKHVSTIGSKTAIVSEAEVPGHSRKLSYLALYELTNQIANVLTSKLGITRGDRVGLYMPLIPETVASFLAILKVGAIVIPVFSGYGVQAIAARLNDCSAKAVITSRSFFRRGKEIEMFATAVEAATQCPSVNSILVYGKDMEERSGNRSGYEGSVDRNLKILSWKSVIEAPKSFETERMDSEDTCMIIYTSGTTGKPKGTVHVHGGLQVKIAEEMAFQMDLHEDDILFWFTDIGWIMAPWEIIGVLTLGATLLIFDGAPDYPASDRLWQVVADKRTTILGVSPTLVRSQMRYGIGPLRNHDFSSVRSFGSTGEPWNPESYIWLFENIGKKLCPIINISGGTEVAACFLSVHPILPTKVCSLGGPALGMDVDVFDEKGNSIRIETGELVVKKPWPSMTRGLWNDETRYIETYWSRFDNVWVHGDWASIDSDGYWFLHGRSDDTLKIAGKRIGPAEIEGVLASHKAVLESVAIGVPDPLKGESIVCFVVLRPGFTGSEALSADLKIHVTRELGPTMRPGEIKFVENLPKTRNAKLVRRLVRARYLNLPLGDMSNLENPESLEAIANAK